MDYNGHRATFVVAVNAPGVTVVCRKPVARNGNPFSAPLSTRFDELDGQMWLDDVLIPWDRVFLTEPVADPVARWLFWHQLYCWLSKAEFTLGLALACTHAMGLASHDATVEYLVDLITDVQTVRSCQTAAELDPEFTPEGYCSQTLSISPTGSIAMLKARPRMGEVLRTLPGSSLVVAPTDRDLAEPALAQGLEKSSPAAATPPGSARPCCTVAWDHVGSALDHRKSVYELHANGGIPSWRGRLRRSFNRYEELANGVLQHLNLPMPKVDLQSIRNAPPGRAPAGQPDRPAAEACGHGTDKKPRYGGESALTQLRARGGWASASFEGSISTTTDHPGSVTIDKPVTPRGVNHLVLNVRDIEKWRRFSTEVVGFRQVGQLTPTKDRPNPPKMRFYSGVREDGTSHHHDVALVKIATCPSRPRTGRCSACPARSTTSPSPCRPARPGCSISSTCRRRASSSTAASSTA